MTFLSTKITPCLLMSGLAGPLACSTDAGSNDSAFDPAYPGGSVDAPSELGGVPSGGAPAIGPGEPPPDGSPGPSARPLRRLTKVEYNNTVRDLLGTEEQPADTFVRDPLTAGFDNISAAQTISPVLAEQYMLAAETLGPAATGKLKAEFACYAAADEACALTIITEFGARAWRRPLSVIEVDRLLQMYRVGVSFDNGVQLVVRTLLSSAPFIFRVETGEPGEQAGQIRPTSFEMASRLSYLFLGSMPNAELFALAAENALTTPAQVEAAARRLLEDPRVHDTVTQFHRQWLSLENVDRTTVPKDTEVFPTFDGTLVPLMREETERFLDSAFWSPGNGLSEMFTASYSYMNAELAAFYGASGPTGDSFERVELNPTQRAGLLTQAGLLALHSHTKDTSPTRRGKFVREVLLCQPLPPPPPDVETVLPEPAPDLTTRERLKEHLAGPACAGCHTLIDPIGLGFENYDGVGLWRDTQGGQPVDATGQVSGVSFGPDFNGIVDLAGQLASSTEVQACLSKVWFRYAYGKVDKGGDAQLVNQLAERLGASGGHLPEFLVALTQTPEFLSITPQGGVQ